MGKNIKAVDGKTINRSKILDEILKNWSICLDEINEMDEKFFKEEGFVVYKKFNKFYNREVIFVSQTK